MEERKINIVIKLRFRTIIEMCFIRVWSFINIEQAVAMNDSLIGRMKQNTKSYFKIKTKEVSTQ